jgi:Putative transposase
LPVRVLSRLFRRLFLEALDQAFRQGRLQFFSPLEPLRDPSAFDRHLAQLRKTEWVVYAKPPWGGPQQVLEYLGRYTHRVAISNQRLLALQDDQVSFQWKDYRQPHQSKVMTVGAEEFIRRFLLHALPAGFQRIRHFGFLANCHRQAKLALCRQLLTSPLADLLARPTDYRDFYQALTHQSLRICQQCGIGRMARIQILPAYRWPTAPPLDSS